MWDAYQDLVTDVQNAASYVTGHNTFVDCDELLKTAREGDLIEFCRGAYNHWAMYSEHYGKVYNICAESKENTTAEIKLQSLREVCNLGPSKDRRRARVNNKDGFRGLLPHAMTGSIEPLPVKESIKKAKAMVGTFVEYSFTGKNCEYYCTLWKFGEGFTDQAYKY